MCVQEQKALASCLVRFYSTTAELVRREAKNISPRTSCVVVFVFVLPAMLKNSQAAPQYFFCGSNSNAHVLVDCAQRCLCGS